jgi:hypothetical protein
MNIKQGANKNYKFYVYQRGEQTPIVARPEQIVFTAQLANGCQTHKLTKTLGSGISFDSTTGKYTLAFVPADTINLPPGNYGFDIKIKRGGGQYFVVNQGYLKIEKSYTGVI